MSSAAGNGKCYVTLLRTEKSWAVFQPIAILKSILIDFFRALKAKKKPKQMHAVYRFTDAYDSSWFITYIICVYNARRSMRISVTNTTDRSLDR